MTPFQEELYRLIQDCKKESNAFTTVDEDAGTAMQKIVKFSQKWDFKEKSEKLEKQVKDITERAAREKLVMAKNATRAIVKELVPIIDECFILQNHVTKDTPLAKGVTLLLANLEKILSRRSGGVIKPFVGEDADPTKHKFIEAEEVPGHRGNSVAEVFRFGYYIFGQVVREAEIKVRCGVRAKRP